MLGACMSGSDSPPTFFPTLSPFYWHHAEASIVNWTRARVSLFFPPAHLRLMRVYKRLARVRMGAVSAINSGTAQQKKPQTIRLPLRACLLHSYAYLRVPFPLQQHPIARRALVCVLLADYPDKLRASALPSAGASQARPAVVSNCRMHIRRPSTPPGVPTTDMVQR
jgi:hypothetical protein